MQNKKGVSLMVGYALLIVIAIALAAFVYPYLKARLPTDRAECKPDTSLSVQEIICNKDGKTITYRLYNNGFFNVTGAFVRIGEDGKQVRFQVNKGTEYLFSSENPDTPGLPPGAITPNITKYFDFSQFSANADLVIEVQPAIFANRALVPCVNKIISQPLVCTTTTSQPSNPSSTQTSPNSDFSTQNTGTLSSA